MSTENNIYDAIVIGAGISGLYTARCLVKEGLDVLVLEARDHVGGRAYTQRDPRFGYADLGGSFVGLPQTKIMSLIKDLGLETYYVPKEGKSVLCVNGQRIPFTASPFSQLLPIMDFNNCRHTIDAMTKEVPLLEPWNAPRAKEWDSITIKEFINKLCWTKNVPQLINHTICLGFGFSNHVSLLAALADIRSCGGFMMAVIGGSKDDLEAMKILGGANSINERMAKELEERILLKSAVRTVDQRREVITVTTHGDKTFQTRQVVVAMSPAVLKHVEFLPSLPESHQAYINYNAGSHAIKTMTYYDRAYWKDKGFHGGFVSTEGIATFGVPDTKPDGTHPCILSFIDGNAYGHCTPQERKEKMGARYADVFQIPEMKNPIDYVEKMWGDEDGERYSGGCVYTIPPKFITKHKALWGESFGNIHFAGVEAAVVMRRYMDGGLRSAERAAVKVLAALKRSPTQQYDEILQEIPYKRTQWIERVLPSVSGLFYTLGALGIVTAISAGLWLKPEM